MHCSVTESADLSDVAMDSVIAEVKKQVGRRIFAYNTRSMSKFGECADSATEKFTQSMYSLRSVTTIPSLLPVLPTFGLVQAGLDRVSV